ncbi:MAG: HEAT repeat domain-containing protein, partial [Planctomycetota bacterium]
QGAARQRRVGDVKRAKCDRVIGINGGDIAASEHPRDVDLRSVAAGQASRYIAGLPERGAESELEDLRELGSKGSPFVAEALVERLAVAGSRAEVLAAAQEDLGSRDAGRRSFGAMALGRLFPTEDPRALLLHSIYDPSPQVRRASALGLADMSASEVCGPLVKALASPSASVRRRAAEALGETRESIFVEPLMDRLLTQSASGSSGAPSLPRGYVSIGTQRAYVQDFDVEVAAGSSISDPVVNTLLEGAVLGAGVISIEKTTITMERRSVRRALQLASGVQPGRGQLRDWKKWWESDDSAPFRQD